MLDQTTWRLRPEEEVAIPPFFAQARSGGGLEIHPGKPLVADPPTVEYSPYCFACGQRIACGWIQPKKKYNIDIWTLEMTPSAYLHWVFPFWIKSRDILLTKLSTDKVIHLLFIREPHLSLHLTGAISKALVYSGLLGLEGKSLGEIWWSLTSATQRDSSNT